MQYIRNVVLTKQNMHSATRKKAMLRMLPQHMTNIICSLDIDLLVVTIA